MFPLFGILHRMIFWELLRVFLMSLTALTGLFLIAGLVQQASQLGLSPSQVLAVIPLLIPSTLPYTIPATTLFASCVVYGRLATDNEAVAMKAAGVDLYTILRPALVLGVFTTAVTAGLYYAVIPQTQQMLQQQILRDPEEVLYNLLKRERCFRPSNFPYAIYVRDVQGRRLLDVVMKRRAKVRAPDGNEVLFGYDFVARAREARLTVDLETSTLTIDPDSWVVWGKEQAGVIEAKPIEIPLPEMFSAKNLRTRPSALAWDELPGLLAELREQREEKLLQRNRNRKAIELETQPVVRKNLMDQEPHFAAQLADIERSIRNVEFEQQVRPSLAVGCLCFALIGCPVGLWAQRSDFLSSFVTCFLPTVFIYYPLLLAGGGLGRDGKVEVWLGVWAANLVVGLGAVGLIRTLIRR